MTNTFRLAVPGKLLIAGEYAVLEPGQRAIVAAIDRYVTVTVTPHPTNCLDLPDLGLLGVEWRFSGLNPIPDNDDARLGFIRQAISVVAAYVPVAEGALRGMRIAVKSELDDDSGRKFGLGSSAAVVVGLVAALLRLVNGSGQTPAPMLVYKLAAIAHFRGQGSGSGADIAASTFGGWLSYSSFGPLWLQEELERERPLAVVVDGHWPHLQLNALSLPEGLTLCVGWTGSPAATSDMLVKVRQFQLGAEATARNAYKNFLNSSAAAVTLALEGFSSDNPTAVLAGLTLNYAALQELGSAAQLPIETALLARLALLAAEAGGAGKSSGSGAGDCGIALIGPDRAAGLQDAWRAAGIQPLGLSVSEHGVAESYPALRHPLQP